jgi:hypothetical protein
MTRTTCRFLTAGLLAVALPILATTTIGARAAPTSGASHHSGIDTPASEPTDFSAARGGGRGGGGGFRGGGGGFRGGGGGFRGGGGGFRGGGGGYRGGSSLRGGGGSRVGGHNRMGGTRTGGTRTGGTRTGSTRTGSTRTGSTRTGTTRTGSTRTGTTRTGTTRTGTTRTGTTRTGTTRTGTTRTGTTRDGTTRTGTTRTGTTRDGTTRTGTTRTGTTRDGTTRTGTTRDGTTRTGTTRTGTTRDGTTRTGTTRTGTTRTGTTRAGNTRIGTTTIRNRRISTFTGRRFWWRGSWRTLIGITLLTGFAIGPDFYYPEGYVAAAEPVCTGYTDDGCALRWQDVAADDGSTIPQCVEFCPRVRKAVTPAPAPVAAAPRSGCEVEVFKDTNLAGASFRTAEDQPILNDEWDRKIASINVISGTWDFTTEQQYNGDAMRLTPGTYRDLGPNWIDQISSFMCAQ